MAVKRPLLCLLLLLPALSGFQELQCVRASYSCDRCIQAGPECAWCSAPNSTVRCHTLQGVQKAGCEESHVFNPQSNVSIWRHEPSRQPVPSRTVYLEPQEVAVFLRPGESQSFRLTITMPKDQSVTQPTLETSRVPLGINITLSSTMQGNPMLVQVNVTASQCPSRQENMTGPWEIQIGSRQSVQRVKLRIHLQCHCDCSLHREENSAACSSRGALVCGHCECNQGYDGESCEENFDPFFERYESYCRPDPQAPVCSNRGMCIDGECFCNRQIEWDGRFSGRFCECSNFFCPRANNKLCGGHGKCECNKCICDEGWAGESCNCATDITSCLAANQQVCNGRGICQCGVCKCTDPRFQGPTCETCPTCPDICEILSPCVACRAFGEGELKDTCDRNCSHFSVTMVDTVNDLPQPVDDSNLAHCKMRDPDDCWFYYSYESTPSSKDLTVVRKKNCGPTRMFF